MRVLLDCRMASWSGVGRYTAGLVRALARRTDVELCLLLAEGDATLGDVGVAETAASSASPLSLAGMRVFGQAAKSLRPDVTHGLHFPTPRPVARPLVVTLHDLTPLLVPGVMPSVVRRAVYGALNSRAVRLADAVITPSANTARDVERVFSAARGKTRVIAESADDFSAGPVGALPQHLEGARYVLSMGSTRPHKDLPTLLKAYARLASVDADLLLVLAGAEQPGYVADVLGEQPGLDRRIVWAGRTSDAELRALYARAAVFAFPSLYEGFGLPPLEAMAMGTPVVVADTTSLPEVVGDAGLLVPPQDPERLADALRRVLEDGALRERLVRAGRGRAAELTWDAAAAATVGVYEEARRAHAGTAR